VCQKKDGLPSFFYGFFPYVATSYLRYLRNCFILQNPVQNESWSRMMKIFKPFFKPFMPLALRNSAPAAIVLIVGGVWSASSALAQERIFRCEGNEYTNNATTAAQRGCKLVEGGNLTVVSAPKPRPAANPADVRVAAATNNSAAPSPAPSRIDTAEQRSRDSDARAILESELKKVEAKQADLLKEFNNGEPEKRGPEMRNNQIYLDRIAEMKAQIARNDSDIAGIKREIGRTAPPSASR
jgi:hypothetical protein